jgi:hypothetical protein
MKKIHFALLILVSVFLFACSSKTNNDKNNILEKDNIDDEVCLNEKIYATMSAMVVKYNLPHNPSIKSENDTIKIQDVYTLYKKIYFPYDDLTLEYWYYNGECHTKVELIICIRNKIVSCIPFVDQPVFETLFRNKQANYTDMLEKELNITYKKLYVSNNKNTNEYSAPNFVYRVMDNIQVYRLNKIETNSELESVRHWTKNCDFSKAPISKADALIKIEDVSEKINYCIPFEYLHFSVNDIMIIEVKINKFDDNQKFSLRVINYELFNDMIM